MATCVGRGSRLYPSRAEANAMTAWADSRRAIHSPAIEQRELAWQRSPKNVTDGAQCRDRLSSHPPRLGGRTPGAPAPPRPP